MLPVVSLLSCGGGKTPESLVAANKAAAEEETSTSVEGTLTVLLVNIITFVLKHELTFLIFLTCQTLSLEKNERFVLYHVYI